MNFLFWKESGGQSLILREEEKMRVKTKKENTCPNNFGSNQFKPSGLNWFKPSGLNWFKP
jgi:hypothetical protein